MTQDRPTETAGAVPDGFRRMADPDALTAALAPLYLRPLGDAGLALGFHVTARHCNPLGHCHGGTWATLADILMGLTVGTLSGLTGPTVSMAIDFAGTAMAGQWVEGQARLLRATPRLGFADCLFTADGALALRASAVFRRRHSYRDVLLADHD